MDLSVTLSDHDIWNEQKKNLHEIKNLPTFKEGEIWWCSVGKNIGKEDYGK